MPSIAIELRLAVGLIAERCAPGGGRLAARVVGVPRLAAELSQYGAIEDDARMLVSLGASREELRGALRALAPERVIALVAGQIARPLGRLRVATTVNARDLALAEWRRNGYDRVGDAGLFGPGALFWTVADSLLRRWRLDLADRSRFAMLQSLPVSRAGLPLAVVTIREYRRRAP